MHLLIYLIRGDIMEFDNKFTKREIMFSIVIVLVMLMLGLVISSSINDMILDENTKYNVYINIVKPKKLTADEVKESILSIAKNMGIEEYDVRINTDYINASNPDPQVIAGGIIVALIIILSSMLVIYSIFYVFENKFIFIFTKCIT